MKFESFKIQQTIRIAFDDMPESAFVEVDPSQVMSLLADHRHDIGTPPGLEVILFPDSKSAAMVAEDDPRVELFAAPGYFAGVCDTLIAVTDEGEYPLQFGEPELVAKMQRALSDLLPKRNVVCAFLRQEQAG